MIDGILDQLNIQDNGVKVKFEIDDYSFWMIKKGYLRRQRAAVLLIENIDDELGFATGKYDELIDVIMSAIVLNKDEPVSMEGEAFYDFVESLEDGGREQLDMLQTLPIASAMVTLGKSLTAQLFLRYQVYLEALKGNTEDLEAQESERRTYSNSVRQLPKMVKPNS